MHAKSLVSLVVFCFFFVGFSVAQKGEVADLFGSDEVMQIKFSTSFKELKKAKDKKERAPTLMYFSEEPEAWDSLDVELRARGNFRRDKCFFPPLKVRIMKKNRKGGIFENHKNLKLVLPCNDYQGKDDLLIKEYLAYKIYEALNPYHFKTRLVDLEITDLSGRQPKSFFVKGIFIEDDKNVAERFEGKLAKDVQINPFRLHDTTSVRHDFFQFMIANTDWSTVAQHNSTLMMIDRKYIPLPYDFDMAGLVDAPYSVVSEKLSISTVRQRLYRGVCFDSGIFEMVREDYLEKEPEVWEIFNKNTKFLNPKEVNNSRKFLEGFFDILKDENKFKNQILGACRSFN
ncbi:hypothetical protein [Indibacter alkaliphilus]|nr:hypothetical protein [Indibacter alkaliphilus]